MSLSFNQAKQLRDFLQERPGRTTAVEKAMTDAGKHSKAAIESVSYRTLDRVAAYTIEEIMNGRSAAALRAYKFLSRRNWKLREEPVDFAAEVRNFLSTDTMKYTDFHLKRMCGEYFMYRRYWFNFDMNRFMRSYLTIKYNERIGMYRIREYQAWEDEDHREASKGFLFPSGQAVLAIMNSVGRGSVKFFSITGLAPDHKTATAKITSFSGNGIAGSDRPPHTGFGFHCTRIEDNDISKDERMETLSYSFEEMREQHFPIFRKIIEYEGYRGIAFEAARRIANDPE